MSNRNGKYWSMVSTPKHRLTFDEVDSMHPLHMLALLKRDTRNEIIDEESTRHALKYGWTSGNIFIKFEVFGLDMPLEVRLKWFRFIRGHEVKYAWGMEFFNVIFNDDTVEGPLGKLYKELLYVENELYSSDFSCGRGTGPDKGSHTCVEWYINKAHDVLSTAYWVRFLITRWNLDLEMCGDHDYVEACNAFRAFLGYDHQLQRIAWAKLCESNRD